MATLAFGTYSTVQTGRFEDTNRMFVPPTHVDYHVGAWFDDTHRQLFDVFTHYLKLEK